MTSTYNYQIFMHSFLSEEVRLNLMKTNNNDLFLMGVGVKNKYLDIFCNFCVQV